MRLRCGKCGKSVSNEVPDDTIVRAWLECPECIEDEGEDVALETVAAKPEASAE